MTGRLVKVFLAVGALVLASAAPAGAQGLYLGLRGGGAIPTGTFSDDTGAGSEATLNAAKSGFGYGLDAGLSLGPLGIYAGFDHINFDCESNTCNSDGKYKLMGVAAGVRLSLPGKMMVHPWVKGGVTFNELQGSFGSSSTTNELTTDRNPGYEIAAGLDIPLLRIFSLYPQARFVGQNFKYKVPGVNNTATKPESKANYMTFDLGLSVHNPLGGMKR
jgi:hypothetical protein